MCTLTWQRKDELEIFFNRDELKTRGRAHPPKPFVSTNGTRYLSPIDADAGGTWMLANEFGLIICLLNRWHIAPTDAGPSISRGKIVTALASFRNSTEVATALPDLCPSARPFDLVVLTAQEQTGFTWEDDTLSPFQPRMPLTSSSYRFEEVKEAREKAFQQTPEPEQFQRSQNLTPSAYTVRMNRPDAQTWSRSRLQIGTTEIRWDYWEEFPNMEKPALLHQASLPLKG